MDKAGLLARAKSLREKHDMEMEEVKLRAKMEALQLREALAIANAKLQALEEMEPMESKTGKAVRSEDGMNTYLERYMDNACKTEEPIQSPKPEECSRVTVVSPPDFVALGAIPKTPLQRAMHVGLHPRSTAAPPKTTAAATRPKLSSHTSVPTLTEPRREQSTPDREPFRPPENPDMANLLVSVVSQTSLPKKEVTMFSGDPLDFQLFMQAIKHNIEDKTDSNEDRLYFLEQYTVGQPKELVRSCLHMDAATGYAEAKRLLKRHFGDDFKITTAYIEKALNWSVIKPDDGKAMPYI